MLGKKLKIEKSTKKQKWNLFNNSGEISQELLKGAHIELFSNRQMVLEGCLGVLEYNDTYLKLRLQNGAIVLCGSSFNIVCFENKTMTIKGKIDSLEFCM